VKRVEKLSIVLSAVGASALLLAGCGTTNGSSSGTGGSGGSGASTSSGKPTVVTVWTWRSQDAPLWNEVQTALNQKGDNIQIQFRAINGGQYGSVLQTALDGGKGPDIFYVGATLRDIQPLAANGLVKPLDGMVDFSQLVNPASLDFAKYNGKTYGVPYAIQTTQWFYNKSIFAKYGLQPPKTWADFINICNVLQKHGVAPISVMGEGSWGTANLMWDGENISASLLPTSYISQLVNKQAKFTDPAFVSFLAHYQQLAQYFEPNWQAVGATGTELAQTFASGKTAMAGDGIWDVGSEILKDNPSIQLGTFLTPPLDSSQSPHMTWYVDGFISMNNKITDPAVEKASTEIEKYTTTQAFAQNFTNIAGEISTIKGTTIPANDVLQQQSSQWLKEYGIPVLWGEKSAMDFPPLKSGNQVSTDTSIQIAERTIYPLLMTNKLTPEQAASEFQKDMAWYFAN
jgi:raffinose/stachyose/melibiose transport system substrate-binding protein